MLPTVPVGFESQGLSVLPFSPQGPMVSASHRLHRETQQPGAEVPPPSFPSEALSWVCPQGPVLVRPLAQGPFKSSPCGPHPLLALPLGRSLD